MKPLNVPPFAAPGLAIVVEGAASALTVRFGGNADLSVIEPLDDYLVAIHTVVEPQNTACVTVDFRELEFMNSSCFKCFVSWLGRIQDLPPAQRYRIVFKSNREIHWQRRSLNALRCFAMDVASIEA